MVKLVRIKKDRPTKEDVLKAKKPKQKSGVQTQSNPEMTQVTPGSWTTTDHLRGKKPKSYWERPGNIEALEKSYTEHFLKAGRQKKGGQ